jgi:hypothetical protein
MRKVKTVAEMKSERMRLKSERIRLENEIENDIEEIKIMLSPVNAAKRGLGYAVHKPADKDLLSSTGGAFTEWIMRYVILRNSGFIKKWVLSKGVSNVLSNVLHKNKDSIYGKLAQIILKFKDRNKKIPTS